jgi:hypothetical protein
MRVVFLGLLLSTATAFTPSFGLSRSTTSLDATRKEFIQTAFIGAASTFFVPPSFAGETVTLPSGVSYVIDKAGTGPLPDRGELAAIRFRAFAGEIKIDDIFDTPEPYYTRVGSGGMLKVRRGSRPLVELLAVQRMVVTPCFRDHEFLTFLAFYHYIGSRRSDSPNESW